MKSKSRILKKISKRIERENLTRGNVVRMGMSSGKAGLKRKFKRTVGGVQQKASGERHRAISVATPAPTPKGGGKGK
jgi:hypothetical protein